MLIKSFLRRWGTLGASLATAATLGTAAFATQAATEYPERPVKVIVGYSPGGSNDVVARLLAKQLQENMGESFVVENRPSMAAIVGSQITARAEPDGYTLMIAASGPIVINPAVYKDLSYDPQNDFEPISMVASFPLIVSVPKDAPVQTIEELIQFTQDNPEEAFYSSSSSAFQLATELLKKHTGLEAEHIPYKGSNESMLAVASNDVTFSMLDPGPAAGAINGDLIRGVAVTGNERMDAFPDIPTLKEHDIDVEIGFWIGLFAPAGTPQEIIDLLEKEVAKAVEVDEVAQGMLNLGLIPTTNTSEEFRALIAEEIQGWTDLAIENDIQVE